MRSMDLTKGVVLPSTWDDIASTGKSMNELGDDWWIRSFAISSDENPFIFEDITDLKGKLGSIEKARIDQPEPIFFLGGTFVADPTLEEEPATETFTPVRSIVVPEDAILVFPLINAVGPDAVELPPVIQDEATGRANVNFFFDDPQLFTATVTVDGTPVSEISKSGNNEGFRRESPSGGFSYTIPENSLSDIIVGEVPAQTIPLAVSDGYYFAYDTSVLKPGSHIINFQARIDLDLDEDGIPDDFTLELNVTYNLLNPIDGTERKDKLNGTKGNDYIDGGNGSDKLMGRKGDDLIVGGYGADVIDGGKGDDELWGNEGIDTFIFKRNYGNDKIFDFEQTEVVRVLGLGRITPVKSGIELPSGALGTEVTWGSDSLTFVGINPDNVVIERNQITLI
ncbi:MAG: calcium-binding protein [Nostocaceae cyanobacterium]|nr:calcium-binding protein [Nostocaceae cyanobacterium]